MVIFEQKATNLFDKRSYGCVTALGVKVLKSTVDSKGFLGELLETLNAADAASDFLLGLVHLALKEHGAVAAYLVRLTRDSRLELVGAYGYTPAQMSALNASIWSNLPSAVAIREGQDLCYPERTDVQSGGVSSESFKENLLIGDWFISIPTVRSKSPIGCLNIEIDSKQQRKQLDDEELGFLKMVSHAALHRFQADNHDRHPADRQDLANPAEIQRSLSTRQVEILRQIVDGRTNYQIGRSLNLSESAIKQETVKIFKQLGVRKRQEAAQLALEVGLFDEPELVKADAPMRAYW